MITFKETGGSFQITDPWFDRSEGKYYRTLNKWSDNGWQFVISATKTVGRHYFDGDVVDHLTLYARQNF